MPQLEIKCKFCGKKATEKYHKTIGRDRHITLTCDHTLIEKAVSILPDEVHLKTTSDSGYTPYPFQAHSASFAEKSNLRVLFAHEMGLGKTICVLTTLASHLKEASPILIVTKSSILRQWEKECIEWLDEAPFRIEKAKDIVPPGFKLYIVSYDLLPRLSNLPTFKTIVLDECQQIKNPKAGRTKMVREISESARFILAASGTPIKNNAEEYFTILNILRPEIFPVKKRFIQDYCEYQDTGYGYKVGGLSHYGETRFKDVTKDFIIRYSRQEVLPDLPKIKRSNLISDLSEKVEEAYNAAVNSLIEEQESDKSSAAKVMNILSYLTQMRHLTGLSKIDSCIEFVEEFISDNSRPITIGVHHSDVIEMIRARLEKLNIKTRTLIGTMNADERNDVVVSFRNKEFRVLLVSILAAGEGLNLQFCEDAIVLERQWNPANEEQFEGRFSRIKEDRSYASHINVTYMVAAGTIDEFFAEIVEKKRSYVAQTLDGKHIAWDESSIMKELTEKLIRQGRSKWRVKV